MGCITSHPMMPDTIIEPHDVILERVSISQHDTNDSVPPTPSTASKHVSPSSSPVSYVFNDIIDDKHMKYMSVYSGMKEPTLFWALGIENESYFMLTKLQNSTTFKALKPKRERYSVDYYKNFKPDELNSVLERLRESAALTYPVYINSHTFQKTDKHLQHKTFYDTKSTPNPVFTESIHDTLLRECPFYKSVYDTSVVFDGDSIEFITQHFHNTTVNECLDEFVQLKRQFRKEVFPFFEKWEIGKVMFPDHNYGLVTFLTTNRSNLLVCNNGTIHINLTLPTMLHEGLIVDKDRFAKEHLTLMEYIQMLQPLMVACYGTPDVLSIIDPSFSIGSLRVSMSRYISLQTYDTSVPINGKLLTMDRPTDPIFWYNTMTDTPYIPNTQIGYDLNFNKFKNHGIEIRFFEWFPEEYLRDVMNLFILLAAHSLSRGQVRPLNRARYSTMIKNCVQQGFTYQLTMEECNIILDDMGLPFVHGQHTAHSLLSSIGDQLYNLYHDSTTVHCMSPHMSRPSIVNYNRMAFETLHHDVFGKPELIIRAELNSLEARTPIVPHHIPSLLSQYNVKVESSPSRCYPDHLYEFSGATIVPAGYWSSTSHSYVLGLKAIDRVAKPTQTLLHFAHCFKGQEGSKVVLDRLKECCFVDYEYMLNRDQKRVISFCAQSGKVGCYLALMAYHLRRQSPKRSGVDLPAFEEEHYRSILSISDHKPTVLLIGYGTAGRRAKEILDQFGIQTTIWTSQTTPDRSVILDHDILIHAIRLPDDPSVVIEPFLTTSDLSIKHRLSIICDISCDMGNPRNTLPIYKAFTTKTKPVQRLDGNIDLIAINNLPSMEPHISSEQFSSILSTYLPELPYMRYTHQINDKAASLYQSYQTFRSFI
jgi:Alanine dehydrogenase/PNT, N-terminal domain